MADRTVTTSASGSGDGTPGNPWTLEQARVNAVDGDRVLIQPGVYSIASTFGPVSRNVRWVGDGDGVIMRAAANAIEIFRVVNGTKPSLNRITFDADGYTGVAINLAGSGSNGIIADCTIPSQILLNVTTTRAIRSRISFGSTNSSISSVSNCLIEHAFGNIDGAYVSCVSSVSGTSDSRHYDLQSEDFSIQSGNIYISSEASGQSRFFVHQRGGSGLSSLNRVFSESIICNVVDLVKNVTGSGGLSNFIFDRCFLFNVSNLSGGVLENSEILTSDPFVNSRNLDLSLSDYGKMLWNTYPSFRKCYEGVRGVPGVTQTPLSGVVANNTIEVFGT